MGKCQLSKFHPFIDISSYSLDNVFMYMFSFIHHKWGRQSRNHLHLTHDLLRDLYPEHTTSEWQMWDLNLFLLDLMSVSGIQYSLPNLATLIFTASEMFIISDCFNFVQYNPINTSIFLCDLHCEIDAYLSKVWLGTPWFSLSFDSR